MQVRSLGDMANFTRHDYQTLHNVPFGDLGYKFTLLDE